MYHTRPSIPLFDAIRWTHKAQATLEHYRIFGLLELSDGTNFVRLPNYEQDLNEMLVGITAEKMRPVNSTSFISVEFQQILEVYLHGSQTGSIVGHGHKHS